MLQFEFIDKRNVLLHNTTSGEKLQWNISGFDNSKIETVQDLYLEFNAYLKWLGNDKQAALWDIYVELHEAISNIENRQLLEVELVDRINLMYDIISVPDVEHWLAIHGNVSYPDGFLTEHDADDRTPDGTYLRSDYRWLVALALALRAMVVVWGSYLFLVRKTIGTDHKEYIAGRLIAHSSIMDCKPMMRLERYINFRISRGIDDAPPVIEGLGTDEIPNWFLANVLIRRMAIGELNATKEGSLISNIFGFINPKLEGMARVFGAVREKHAGPEEDGSDNGTSILEMFRAKQQLTTGDVATLNVYAENIHNLAAHIDPTIEENQTLLEDCYRYTICHMDMMLHRTQEILVQWIIHNPMSARAVPDLQRIPLLNAIAVSQALLIHWGLADVAAVLIASASYRTEDDMLNNVVQNKIPADTVSEILRISPFYCVKDVGNPKKSNYALLAIHGLSKDIHALKWTLRYHPTIVGHIPEGRIDAGGIYTLPCNMAEQLAKLTIILDNLR
jgi:hypothetical protein